MMHEVMHGFTDERVLGSIAREKQIVAVDRHAAGAGEMVGMIEGMESLLRLARGVKLGIHRRRKLDFGRRWSDRGISAQVSLVEGEMKERIAVVAAEPVALIVAVAAEF